MDKLFGLKILSKTIIDENFLPVRDFAGLFIESAFLKTGPVFGVPMDQVVRILPSPQNGMIHPIVGP